VSEELRRPADPRTIRGHPPLGDRDNAPDPAAPVVASGELLGTSRELTILHGQETYRLRLTRHGKLILTK